MDAVTSLAVLKTITDYIKDIGSFALNQRDREKLQAIQFDMTNKVIDIQAVVIQLQQTLEAKNIEIREAGQRLAELEGKQRERDRYKLANIGIGIDFFAYQLKPSSELTERTDEPPHFLCQVCFDAGNKSVLLISKPIAKCLCCGRNVTIDTELAARNAAASIAKMVGINR